MGLYKRAHVRGINFELVRQGLIRWPSEKIAEEAADAVADNIPEEEMAEVSPEEGLTPEEAAGVIEQLVEVAEEIAEKTGGAYDEDTPHICFCRQEPDAVILQGSIGRCSQVPEQACKAAVVLRGGGVCGDYQVELFCNFFSDYRFVDADSFLNTRV